MTRYSIPLLIAGIYALTVLVGLGRFDPTLASLTARIQEMSRGQTLPHLPPPPVLSAAILAQSLTLGMLVTSVFTFGEEFGWTGYLLVQLLPLGRWRAALIYGAIWGLWHAPIIAGGYNYPGYPVIGVVMMCALTIAFALTQTASRLRFDSVLLTSFFHASINTQGLGITWREGGQRKLRSRFAAVRVRPAHRDSLKTEARRGMVADRMATRRGGTYEVLGVDPAAEDQAQGLDQDGQTPLDYRTGL